MKKLIIGVVVISITCAVLIGVFCGIGYIVSLLPMFNDFPGYIADDWVDLTFIGMFTFLLSIALLLLLALAYSIGESLTIKNTRDKSL